jgi:hypothetical protein
MAIDLLLCSRRVPGRIPDLRDDLDDLPVGADDGEAIISRNLLVYDVQGVAFGAVESGGVSLFCGGVTCVENSWKAS